MTTINDDNWKYNGNNRQSQLFYNEFRFNMAVTKIFSTRKIGPFFWKKSKNSPSHRGDENREGGGGSNKYLCVFHPQRELKDALLRKRSTTTTTTFQTRRARWEEENAVPGTQSGARERPIKPPVVGNVIVVRDTLCLTLRDVACKVGISIMPFPQTRQKVCC